MNAPYHVRCAAEAFAEVMAELRPECAWVPVIREREPGDGERSLTAGVRGKDAGAVLEHPNLVVAGDATAAHDNGLKKAA